MDIYRARPDLAAVVGGLLFDFNEEFETTGPLAAEFAARFRVLLARDDVLVWLAGPVTDPVGFAYLTLRPTPYHDGPLAQLEELYVRPDLRAAGIGSALMATVLRDLRARDCGEVHINVDEIDLDTRRFYERLGFVNIEPGADYRMLCYIQEL